MSELSFIKLRKIERLGDHRLRLFFSNGEVGEHDFSALVSEEGSMVEPLRDAAYFARVFIDFGAPTWPNGFDLAPYALHAEMKKAGELRQLAAE
jgi:hypothetical protein